MSDEITTTVEAPTKKTLDDIEKFGIEFTNGFTVLRNISTQNLAMAKKYIVVDEQFDENGVRTSYTFHSNLEFYTPDEKANMLKYYDFLKETSATILDIEHMNGLSFYDIMNTRAKLDALISATMSSILVG